MDKRTEDMYRAYGAYVAKVTILGITTETVVKFTKQEHPYGTDNMGFAVDSAYRRLRCIQDELDKAYATLAKLAEAFDTVGTGTSLTNRSLGRGARASRPNG